MFKTQAAYQQFWAALGHVDQMLMMTRCIAMGTCTMFDWEKDPKIRQYARKVIRLLAIHYFVVIEYFRRTGSNAISNAGGMDELREDIRRLTGPTEFSVLYPDEDRLTPGSASRHAHTHPLILVFWIQLVLGRCFKDGGIVAPACLGLMCTQVAKMMEHFWAMDQIDKTQFPLPYAQLVKVLCCIWIFTFPFVLEPTAGLLTPFAMAFIALGMFGLDEVAEILESPFGNDPNDIDLREYGEGLLQDLELMYYGREMRMDVVFTDEEDLRLMSSFADSPQRGKARRRTSDVAKEAVLRAFQAPNQDDAAQAREVPKAAMLNTVKSQTTFALPGAVT